MAEEGSAVPERGGPLYLGAGELAELLTSFADDGQMMLMALKADGTIAYVSKAVEYVLGYKPADITGKQVVDLVHPDELERVIWHLAGEQAGSMERGITKFLAAHADGSWMPIEVLASIVSDGVEPLIGIYGRRGLNDVLLQDVLGLLLTGSNRSEALAPVANSIQWEESGSHLAISWEDDTGFNQVSTGLPDALGGGDGAPGTPWTTLRLGGGGEVRGNVDDLPEPLSQLARSSDLADFWIKSVEWSESWPPAMVTIWTSGGARSPILHSYGMEFAVNLSQLILRWTEQLDQLERAARRDSLTGLVNRGAFFAALDLAEGGGAVLYCDLDHFKPVNDVYGHTVGDQVLRLASRRLQACVRDADVVGRLGGDEFGILCVGASREEAEVIAGRIRSSLAEPFRIEDLEVVIGVSVGVASDPQAIGDRLLDMADQALVDAKAERREGRAPR